MAHIVFWTWDEPGHVNPVLELGARLVRRGHSVGFIAGERIAAQVRAHGFDDVAAPPFDAYRGPREPCRTMADAVQAVRALGADLILCDALRTFELMLARAAGVACAVYSTSLPFWSDPIGPRIDRDVAAPSTRYDRLRVALSWQRNGLRQWLYRLKWMCRHRGYREANRFLEQTRRQLGMHAQDIGWNSIGKVPLPYFRRVSTVALCPQALDFPRGDAERLIWTDPCILRERPQQSVPTGMDPNKPLIFASLGTQVHRVRWAEKWFASVCDCLEQHPQWQGVLATSEVCAKSLAHRAIPGRLTIVASVAQQLLLPRTAVAVIHGGLNSVKECIMAGVPMAVFPTGYDQPGNAARIRAKGIGLVGRGRSLRPDDLASMLRTLIEDPGYRARVAAMREEFLQSERTNSAADAVDALLVGR